MGINCSKQDCEYIKPKNNYLISDISGNENKIEKNLARKNKSKKKKYRTSKKRRKSKRKKNKYTVISYNQEEKTYS